MHRVGGHMRTLGFGNTYLAVPSGAEPRRHRLSRLRPDTTIANPSRTVATTCYDSKRMRIYLIIAILVFAIASAEPLLSLVRSGSRSSPGASSNPASGSTWPSVQQLDPESKNEFMRLGLGLHSQLLLSEQQSEIPLSLSGDEASGRVPLKVLFSGFVPNKEFRNGEFLIIEAGDGNEDYAPVMPPPTCLGQPCPTPEQQQYALYYTYTSPGVYKAGLYFEQGCRFLGHYPQPIHIQCSSANKRLLVLH